MDPSRIQPPDIDIDFEGEFERKIEEIAAYQPTERVTLDGEWTEIELADDVRDECYKLGEEIHKDYLYKAVRDRNLLIPEQLAEKIIGENDLVDRYNEAVAKNNSKVFGIVKFDSWLSKEIDKVLKDNLLVG